MLRRLLPREEDFFALFERHAALTVEGAVQFRRLVEGTGGNIHAIAARIKELEHETDVITHACVEKLHKVFLTPFDRDDIHRLISLMDDFMDLIESASERIALYDVTVMTPQVQELADVLVKSTRALATAVAGLRDLKRPQAILDACIEVNRLENECDEILRESVGALFREEQDVRQLIKHKNIYEYLEYATDKCQDVANVIESVIVENV